MDSTDNSGESKWLWRPVKTGKRHAAGKEKFERIGARPTTESLLIYRNLRYSPWFSLGEFVDNSITSFVKQVREEPGNSEFECLKVHISWDPGQEKLEILDNAAGIPATQEGWGRALKVGARNPDPTVLSVHGYGMKAAGLWWAKSMEISSKFYRDDVVRTVTFDPEELIKLGEDDVPVETFPADSSEDHWTHISLHGLNPGRTYPVGRTLGKVREFLASMYRHYLRGTSGLVHPVTGEPFVKIFLQNDELAFREKDLLVSVPWTSQGPDENQPEMLWRKDVSLQVPSSQMIDGTQPTREVTGWVGILRKMDRSDAGLFLSFHGKGIFGVAQGTTDSPDQYKPQVIFGAPNSFRFARIVGELDISDYGKSATTDSASWSDEDEHLFLKELEKNLRQSPNLLTMAERFRVSSPEEMTVRQQKSQKQRVNEAAKEAGTIERTLREKPSEISTTSPPPKFRKEQVIAADEPIILQSGHEATFQTVFGRESDDWLSIYPDAKGRTKIIVNNNHPYVRRHFPVENQGTGLWQLAIAIATAELSNPRLSEFRTELNRWLLLSGHYSFLNLGSGLDE